MSLAEVPAILDRIARRLLDEQLENANDRGANPGRREEGEPRDLTTQSSRPGL